MDGQRDKRGNLCSHPIGARPVVSLDTTNRMELIQAINQFDKRS